MKAPTLTTKLEVIRRTLICNKCPICNLKDWVCNGKLYLNPVTNDVSTKPLEGYIKGCSCHLNYKISYATNHCPAKKW